MQNIKNHKVLAFFNFLAIFLIIFGITTDFTVPDSGTSISGAITAWGGFLLIVMLIVTGIAVLVHSKKHPNGPGTNMSSADKLHQQEMAKITGISIILGALLGLVAAYIFLEASSGGDDSSDMAGIVFIFVAPIFAALGAFILYALAKIIYGDNSQKKRGIIWFIIVFTLVAAYIGYVYYEDQYGQKYCDGQPIEQYQGEVPSYCLIQ